MQKATLTKIVKDIVVSPHIGEGILPYVPVATEKTVWDIVETDLGMAKFAAPDAESPLIDKLKIEQAAATIASIREKERFIESDLRAMREAGELPLVKDNPQTLLAALRVEAEQRLRRSLNRQKTRVASRVEWMRWQALQGNITYDDGEIKFAIDYGIPSANQVTLSGTQLWSDTTNADPLKNINDWIDTFIENRKGLSLTRMYCSRKILGYMAQNAKIRSLLKYNSRVDPAAFGSPKQAKNLILNMTDMIEVHVFDSFYEATPGATGSRFLPQNRIILLPPALVDGEVLGDVADGPHAHNDYHPGYYTWTEKKKDPYTVFVGVGRECFPRIYHPDWIFIADVY